jgi:hypothetical protein
MKQAKLSSCQEVQDKLPRDDINVQITIRNIPGFLVKEFAEKVAKPYYTQGIGEAIKDLMWEAVQSQKIKHEASKYTEE